MNEIISCGDAIAQQYLMESIIQVFPDDFQLAGLSHTLVCLCHLDRSVNISLDFCHSFYLEDLFSKLLQRIQGGDVVSTEVFNSLVNSVFEFIRTLHEVFLFYDVKCRRTQTSL